MAVSAPAAARPAALNLTRFLPAPAAVVGVICLVALSFLVIVPIAWLVLASFQDPDAPSLNFRSWDNFIAVFSHLNISNYSEAFTHRIYLDPILNSLKLAISVATIATIAGTALAWLVSRTDLPGRAILRPLILAAFVTPSFLGAEGWIFLAAPNSGWINKIWVALFHTEHGPVNVFSMQGAIFVIALYSIPYTFSFVSATLDMMPSELEDAATTLGSGIFRTTWSVTLPLALPAILSGFLLSFLEALELFGPPAFLLIPARQQVMTTQLYLFFSDSPPQVEVAAAYAMPLLLVTAALLLVQRRILGRRRFTTVGGKGGVRRRMQLRRWKWPFFSLAFILPLLSVILPYTAMLLVSLERNWGVGPFAPGNLTLYWYEWALSINGTTREAIVHSLSYGAGAATIAVVVATAVAYMAVRKLFNGAQVFAFVAMAPFVLPGIVLAIGFFAAYTHPPLILYGTAGILIAAYATRFLPIAFSNSNSILQGLTTDLENAARTLGAGRLRSLWTITVPLLRRGVLTSWLLVFIPALKELSASVFLFTPHTQVITTVIWDFSDAGNFEAVSTMGVLMMLITFVIVVVAYRVIGREVIRGAA